MKTNTIEDVEGMIKVLIADVEMHLKLLMKKDDPFRRRSFVRSVFACVEGTTFFMKHTALRKHDTLFSDAERAILKEENYALDNRGIPQIQNARLPTLHNIRFSFNAFSRAYRTSFSLPVSGYGWEAMRKALLLRHKLMHPKKKQDLDVNDQDQDNVLAAFKWFSLNVGLCMRKITENIIEDINKRRNTLKDKGVSTKIIDIKVRKLKSRLKYITK